MEVGSILSRKCRAVTDLLYYPTLRWAVAATTLKPTKLVGKTFPATLTSSPLIKGMVSSDRSWCIFSSRTYTKCWFNKL
jgi:hypothetical protein